MRQRLERYQETFQAMKARGEAAMGQLSPEALERAPGPESNSVAVIVQHLHGNMRSRWTDFLTEDGEKPDRNRDAEFEGGSSERTLELWAAGWACVFAALEALSDADLERQVTIRGNALSADLAILRQLEHYAGHVGQIVYLAKWLRGTEWQTLSIARGASKAYTPRAGGLEGERVNGVPPTRTAEG